MKDNIKNYTHGFSLLEFLIAMSLGLFLLMGMGTLYVNQIKTYNYLQGVNQIQENGNLSSLLLAKPIRMATLLQAQDNNQLILHQQNSIIKFYLADTKRKNKAGDKIRALYAYDAASPHHHQELLEGIEAMQIQYGIPNNYRINFYQADQVPDWQKVRLIKIALLLASTEAVCDKPQVYYYLGKNNLAPDRRLRKEWLIFTCLRNIA